MTEQETDEGEWTGDVWQHDEWSLEEQEELANCENDDDDDDDDCEDAEVWKEFRLNASSSWEAFYDRNGTNFFKDRHYLHKAFPAEFGWLYNDHQDDHQDCHQGCHQDSSERNARVVVEIGCGVGNAILPLLEQHASRSGSSSKMADLQVCCLDFSPAAIQLLRQDPRFQLAAEQGRATAHVVDVSSMPFSPLLPGQGADVAVLLFCLSAVGPFPSSALTAAAHHVAAALKPGGVLVLRDYGRLDQAHLKLARQVSRHAGAATRLAHSFYRKGDGTACYYFQIDDLKRLFVDGPDSPNLHLLDLDFICRRYRNRADGTVRRRVWIQGRFRKPINTSPSSNPQQQQKQQQQPIWQQFLNTSISSWDNYYRHSSSNLIDQNEQRLFRMYPEEFQYWQPLLSQHPTTNSRRNRMSPSQSYTQHSPMQMPSQLTIMDVGCGLGDATILNLLETQQRHYQHSLHQQQSTTTTTTSSSSISSSSSILQRVPKINAIFLDASQEAISQLRQDVRYQNATKGFSRLHDSNNDTNNVYAHVHSQVYDLTQAIFNVTNESNQSNKEIEANDANYSNNTNKSQFIDSADIVLLHFTLSCIGPYSPKYSIPTTTTTTKTPITTTTMNSTPNQNVFNRIRDALQTIFIMMRPGATLLFRDYARYDYNQLKYNSIIHSNVYPHFYIRKHYSHDPTYDDNHHHDNMQEAVGTGCQFFELDEVRELMTSVGLHVLELRYVTRVYKQKYDSTSKKQKKGKDDTKTNKSNTNSNDKNSTSNKGGGGGGGVSYKKRIWIHGRFQKPFSNQHE